MLRPGVWKDKKTVVNALKKLRNIQCQYLYGDTVPCDCKYGFADKEFTDPNFALISEVNCCPELRVAICVLQNITNRDWEKYKEDIQND